MALSMMEAEYIATGFCCAQILWIKQQLENYGIKLNKIFIKYDNISSINLTKNLMQHSRTKHIGVRHHFIRDHVQNGNVLLDFVSTNM